MCQKYTDLNILQEKEISIDNGTESCVTIKTDSQFTGILLAGEHAEDVKKKLEMRDPLTAPVDSGEELGRMGLLYWREVHRFSADICGGEG